MYLLPVPELQFFMRSLTRLLQEEKSAIGLMPYTPRAVDITKATHVGTITAA